MTAQALRDSNSMPTAILDAAAQLIAERGYHRIRISDIAEVVGTSTGAVHYYFESKRDVLTAALQHSVERALVRQKAELDAITNAHERLLKLIDMQMPRVGLARDEWVVWVQFWAEVIIGPELRPTLHVYYSGWRDTIRQIIEDGKRQGLFRSDIDPESATQVLFSLIDGTVVHLLTGAPDMTISSAREILAQYVQDALVASPRRYDAVLSRSRGA